MIADFQAIPETEKPHFKDGEGSMFSRGHQAAGGNFMLNRLPKGATIGMHTHTENKEIIYVISGQGRAVIDGLEELLTPGVCHFCPSGSSHTIINTGDEDLVFFAAVVN